MGGVRLRVAFAAIAYLTACSSSGSSPTPVASAPSFGAPGPTGPQPAGACISIPNTATLNGSATEVVFPELNHGFGYFLTNGFIASQNPTILTLQTLLPCAPGVPSPPGGGSVQMAFTIMSCCRQNLTLSGSIVADLPTGVTAQGSYDLEVVPSTPNYPSVFSATLDGNSVIVAYPYPGIVIDMSNYTTHYILVVQH